MTVSSELKHGLCTAESIAAKNKNPPHPSFLVAHPRTSLSVSMQLCSTQLQQLSDCMAPCTLLVAPLPHFLNPVSALLTLDVAVLSVEQASHADVQCSAIASEQATVIISRLKHLICTINFWSLCRWTG